MANNEHLNILKQGIKVWNQWRENNPKIVPDLSEANLTYRNLATANFSMANLEATQLTGANLEKANLSNANLNGAYLNRACLNLANLYCSTLINSDLQATTLYRTNLEGTNLWGALIIASSFNDTNLRNTNFRFARIGFTTFGNVDLSEAKWLEQVYCYGPCSIGNDTLYKSNGKIPESFLRAVGMPEVLITHIPSLVGAEQVIQFYSCFISYSTKDDDFARRLYSRLRDEHIRVWFAPEDVQAGKKLYEQIEQAIQLHDRLLLVLSENSIESEWVMTEIRNARRIEIEEKRRKLFPIRLVDFETICKWSCFDAQNGKDLATEVREYFIPDFSNWKNHDAFEGAFFKLLRDFKSEDYNEGRA